MEPARRLEYVDSLRAVAAVAVLLQHLLEEVDETGFRGFLDLAPGVFGVVTFFYISGMVIPLSVRSNPGLLSFLTRRVFRIYPAYIFVLLIMAGFALVGHPTFHARFADVKIGDLVANVLLVQEYVRAPALLGVSWTLSLEFVWYGVFAFLFYAMRQRRLVWVVHLFSFALLLVSAASWMFEMRVPVGRLGMLGAALIGYVSARWHANAVSTKAYVGAICAFVVALVASQWVAFGYFVHPKITLAHTLTAWLSATALFLLVMSSERVRHHRLLSLSGVVFIGQISYSIYLLHMPIMILSQGMDEHLRLVVVPCLSVLAAWASYRWVECSGISLGRFIEKRVLARPAAPAQPERQGVLW